MVELKVRLISEMYDYLSQGTAGLAPSDGAFVFGRQDSRLAQLATDLYSKNLVRWALFTGGLGKDSGSLARLGLPEALYLASNSIMLGLPAENVYVETAASNGGENCRNGLDLIGRQGLKPSSLTVVAHATSLKRLVMMLKGEIENRNLGISVQSVATEYPFDPSSLCDALEASQEILRMADWPANYGYPEDPELGPKLVDYARQVVQTLK